LSSYQETLDFLFSQLPMYQRVGSAAYKADLSNTEALMDLLGHPEKNLKFIHVAGTNGKGSVSHILASILQEAGFKTGLYTSPHLVDFRERIKINGKMIPKESVVDFVKDHSETISGLQASFFEWTFALALEYFRNQKVDVVVLETGMGGRLDSTNVVTPLLCLVTNISMDHAQFLGNTLEAIAGEKAGIIKEGVPVVLGNIQEELIPVFRKVADEKSAPLSFTQKGLDLYTCDLKGHFQDENQSQVLTALKYLSEFQLAEESVQNGIEQTALNTGLRGRFERLQEQPLVIADIAHNKGAVEVLVKEIQKFHRKVHCVWGVVNDKKIEDILQLLPEDWTFYYTQASIPRALDVTKLEAIGKDQSKPGSAHKEVSKAFENALQNSQKEDLILISGSAFVVADLLVYLEEKD